MRKTLTDKGIAALKPRAQRYAHPDPELVGHYVRVQPSGAKSFVTVAYTPAGKQVWTTIGAADVMSVGEARAKARDVIKRLRAGEPAFEPAPDTFSEIADQWLKRYAEPKGLRSLYNIRRLLNVHILPRWADRPLLSLRRSDVTALLDEVEDDHGARQADIVLTLIRSIMNWVAIRRDDYTPPVVRGMKRQDQKEQSRSRILDDDELRAVWRQAEAEGPYGAFIRIALLTAQRRSKVQTMRWSDVSLDGVWTIPLEKREKGNAEAIKLPKLALDIIQAQPRIGQNPYVFAGRGNGYFNGLSKPKQRFDAKLPGMAPWTVHDLRRTARSLMSRAGVRPDVAERVMGHAKAGVEGTYDRHRYADEKADALQRLATLIESIVHPQDNVLPLPARRQS